MSNTEIKTQIERLLFADIAKFWLNLYKQKYTWLVDELAKWPLLQNKPAHEDIDTWLMTQTIAFLKHRIEILTARIQTLDQNHRIFVERINHAELKLEKQIHILRYAKELGASDSQLDLDKHALERWFDEHAVAARYQHQRDEQEQLLKFLIGKLGQVATRYLTYYAQTIEIQWEKLDFQSYFTEQLTVQRSLSIRHSIFRALVNLTALLHKNNSNSELQSNLVAHLIEALEHIETPYQAKLDILEILIHQRPTFVRAHMWAYISESELIDDGKPSDIDSLFLQSAFSRIILSQRSLSEKDYILLSALADHCYPRVRQSVIEEIEHAPDEFAQTLLNQRFETEADNAIRFTLVKQISAVRWSDSGIAWTWWNRLLIKDEALEIKRFALELTPRLFFNHSHQASSAQNVLAEFIEVLNTRLTNEPSLALRRVIARVKEQLVGYYHQHEMVLLEQWLKTEQPTVRIAKGNIDATLLGRLLSIKAQKMLQFSVSSDAEHWYIHKVPTYRFRLWRFVHEWRNPSTDKRSAHNHTTAYVPEAELFIPSSLVAEISDTQVPGEPLYHLKELSARPHLPHLDHLLSILSKDKPSQGFGEHASEGPSTTIDSRCFTPDGILQLSRPKSLWQKLRAYFQLSRHYAKLDELRNGPITAQQQYLNYLKELGFTLSFAPYGSVVGEQTPTEHTIEALYSSHSLGKLGVIITNLWLSFKEYSISIYQNSILQLLFFVSAFSAYFFARHIKVSHDIIKNRNAIPVSIGGWGTRGKSGTERLKAALFASLSLRVISKTTGCEAMMIYSKINGEQFEIPLFRPFDKASIWEQSDVLKFAAKVKADVFLWECMGLTPRYVRILRRWMRDNFTTITNAYPDHEDILGPRGIDVAKEMSAFIGENTQIFTCEQTMMPILDKDAKAKNSSLIQVHWGDGYQITPEIRALYPYQEHPDNIALVCKMAAYIGISKDTVFKETSQRIIPDVGVLQTFGPERVYHCTQEFINGMSANERLATIENWTRLRLSEKTDSPTVQSIALVNNRNDRIARSRVFAEILANDLAFEYIVIIGTNVDGFISYLHKALLHRLDNLIALNDKAGITQFMQFLGIDRSLKDYCDYCFRNQLLSLDASIESYPALIEQFQKEENLPSAKLRLITSLELSHYWHQINKTGQLEGVKASIESLLERWVALRVIPIFDAHTSADHINITIASLGQVGQHQVIFGMQNIKGPGLTFVNAWQKWQKIDVTIKTMLSKNIAKDEFARLTSGLSHDHITNLIACNRLSQEIALLKKHPAAQNEFIQADLQVLEQRLVLQSTPKDEPRSHHIHPIMRFIIQVAESFLDAGAAVKRKKRALQIYDDIANQRITIEKAVELLRTLNRSQKQGWLLLQLKQNSRTK